jgi:hypothetical protein
MMMIDVLMINGVFLIKQMYSRSSTTCIVKIIPVHVFKMPNHGLHLVKNTI